MKITIAILSGIFLARSFLIGWSAEMNSSLSGSRECDMHTTDKEILRDIPGGFTEIQNSDKQAVAAAKFAVTSRDVKLKFECIEKAERQIVAGTNFRIKLTVTENGRKRLAYAVVFRKLDGQQLLVSWMWLQ